MLSPREQLQTLVVFSALICFRLLIYYVPYRRWSFLLSAPVRHRILILFCTFMNLFKGDDYVPRLIGRLIGRAAGIVPGSNCLAQALCCSLLLTAAGFVPFIRIGVLRDNNGAFQAHAWVELENEVIVGNNGYLGSYARLPLEAAEGIFGRGRALRRLRHHRL
jgi:hypothetical protein